MLLRISKNSQVNTCVRVSFLIRLQASGLQFSWLGDSKTVIFPWVFGNFLEHLAYRTPPGNCFWIYCGICSTMLENIEINKKFKTKQNCVKSVLIRNFSFTYFAAFGLAMEEIWSIFPYSVRMWENTEHIISEYGHFSRSVAECVFP